MIGPPAPVTRPDRYLAMLLSNLIKTSLVAAILVLSTGIVHAEDDAALLASLQDNDYPAQVERGVVIAVAAFEWNCPQHIPVRYSQAWQGTD